jgi:hypothetical protein
MGVGWTVAKNNLTGQSRPLRVVRLKNNCNSILFKIIQLMQNIRALFFVHNKNLREYIIVLCLLHICVMMHNNHMYCLIKLLTTNNLNSISLITKINEITNNSKINVNNNSYELFYSKIVKKQEGSWQIFQNPSSYFQQLKRGYPFATIYMKSVKTPFVEKHTDVNIYKKLGAKKLLNKKLLTIINYYFLLHFFLCSIQLVTNYNLNIYRQKKLTATAEIIIVGKSVYEQNLKQLKVTHITNLIEIRIINFHVLNVTS